MRDECLGTASDHAITGGTVRNGSEQHGSKTVTGFNLLDSLQLFQYLVAISANIHHLWIIFRECSI